MTESKPPEQVDDTHKQSSRTARRRWRSRPQFWTVISAIATVVGTAIAAVAYADELGIAGGAADRITFDFDPGLAVERCATLSGTAPQKDDATLWVATAANDRFYLHEIDRHDDEEWRASITIGAAADTATVFEVHVFYLDNDISKFLASVHGVSDDSDRDYWYAETLPTTEAVETSVVRSTTADSAQCIDP
jgi:hypothetical protein